MNQVETFADLDQDLNNQLDELADVDNIEIEVHFSDEEAVDIDEEDEW